MYIDLFHKAGALSLASAALLGWLMALQRTDPKIIMMGLILLASGTAFPDLPDHFAGPLLIGTILNPLGFLPLMFFPTCDQSLIYRAGIGFSFISSSIGFVGMAYHAVDGDALLSSRIFKLS